MKTVKFYFWYQKPFLEKARLVWHFVFSTTTAVLSEPMSKSGPLNPFSAAPSGMYTSQKSIRAHGTPYFQIVANSFSLLQSTHYKL